METGAGQREKEKGLGWLRERSVRVVMMMMMMMMGWRVRGGYHCSLFSAQSCSSWGTEVPILPLTCKGNQSNVAAPVREEEWGAGGEPGAQFLGSLTLFCVPG